MHKKLLYLISVFVLALLCTSYTSAGIVYVDATDASDPNVAANTTLATGEVFTADDPGTAGSGADGLWRKRVFANDGTIFESGGSWEADLNTEDCPRLMTSVDVPEGDYDVYVYFWADGDPWRIAASLENSEGDLPLFLANDPNSVATIAVAEDFEEPVPLLTEDNRTLWQAHLGTTGSTTNVVVYIDDEAAHITGSARTWYDGIGYKVVPPPPPPKVIWVTDADIDRDLDGVQDDQQWIDWLVAEGYDVDARPGYWMAIGGKDANDANDYVGELNAADLVILSRTASSGDYNQEGEPALWNSVTSPLISLSAWHLRNNRWFWIDSGDVQRSNISFMQVLDPNHPIFADVEIDQDGLVEPVDPEVYSADVGYQGTCFVNSLDMGNGKLLAKSLAEMAWIAEWDAGVEFYDGANAFAGGPRMMFSAGTQDEAGAVPQGGWNLTAAGEQMLRNAIEYMLSLEPVGPAMEGLVAHYALEGDALDSSGNGLDGVLMGDPGFAAGVVGMAIDLDGDGDYVDCGNPDGAFDFTEQMTVAAWVNIRSLPTTWCAVVVKGENGWRLANNGSLTSFQYGINYWQKTSDYGVNGATQIGMDEWHHVCGTYDGATITIYMDGAVDGTTSNDLGIDVSTTNMWIGANSEYQEQRYWDGLIDEVMILDRALSADEVANLAGQ